MKNMLLSKLAQSVHVGSPGDKQFNGTVAPTSLRLFFLELKNPTNRIMAITRSNVTIVPAAIKKKP